MAIAVTMKLHRPGLERDAAQALVTAAHEVCPCSNVTRGNVDVQLSVA